MIIIVVHIIDLTFIYWNFVWVEGHSCIPYNKSVKFTIKWRYTEALVFLLVDVFDALDC